MEAVRMVMEEDKRYLRIECVLYVELADDESPEDGEDRFLENLPDKIDCASFRSEMWYPDEEE